MDEECPGGELGPSDGCLLVRIHVPELNVQKCLQFPRDQLVWDVKQQCLASVPKVATWFRELKESFNYGLFSPPQNGRAGKFLDEERRLGDYPFSGAVGYLELKYKRRVYKMVNLDEKQLRALHTRTNFRRMLDYVNNGQIEKIGKMCGKGFDPNFHCPETGETPLTLATATRNPGKTIIALVNGGAILDFRTKDGATAVHRAVTHNSMEALKTLLELGASPNYKDAKGLTPLYLSVNHAVDASLSELLLHDHATIGSADLQGWREAHQACRAGLLTHLEHLIFYGADLNVQNASGNTPLHVCAVDNQESCARLLLFRGADKEALNFANQTPYQVAVIAGNLELAEIIKTHRPEDVVAFRETPCYKQGRRMSCYSNTISMMANSGTNQWRSLRGQSPSPSLCSLCGPPYVNHSHSISAASANGYSLRSSASSSMSEASDASHFSHMSSNTDKSVGDTSDIISESSGVGTSSDTNVSLVIGTTVVCVQPYTSTIPGHLQLNPGDIIEVTGCNEDGMLEGRDVNFVKGLFPTSCVEEMRGSDIVRPVVSNSSLRVQGRREATHFATAPRLKKSLPSEPRTVVLHRARKGFGFVLRGAKAASPLMELVPSEKCPGLQYLDDVDEGGVADRAGLRKGDYLIAINGEDVSAASHERVVDLIRRSGDLVQMTVVSLVPGVNSQMPSSKSAVNFNGTQASGRQCVTLPRNLASGGGTLGRTKAPLPPRRDPNTTLSMGRSRHSRHFADQFADLNDENRSSAESIHQDGTATPRTASVRSRPISSRITALELEELFQRQRGDPIAPSESQPASRNNSVASTGPGSPRVYASVAEMKRSKNKGLNKLRLFGSKKKTNISELHRDFHSTPDLAHLPHPDLSSSTPDLSHSHSLHPPSRSHDCLPLQQHLPPPTDPPPPPPTLAEVVAVDTSRGLDAVSVVLPANKSGVLVSRGEVVSAGGGSKGTPEIQSSFRPKDVAKLYATPEEARIVGFRPQQRMQVRKTQSLRSPPRVNSPPILPPIATVINVTSPISPPAPPIANTNTNPYAQPFRPNTKRTPPLIPDPDYSASDSDEETAPVVQSNNKLLLQDNGPASAETSGNSNSSSNSSNVPHSFSVQEIQQVRTKLKSSKSYPNDFAAAGGKEEAARRVKEGGADVDGDNSSSGVSSDQDVPPDDLNTHPSVQMFHRQNSIRISNKQKAMQIVNSLAQLPPPLEEEPSSAPTLLPPPPDFPSNELMEMEVLAPPPPQFSDGRLVTRVRVQHCQQPISFNQQPRPPY